MDSMIADVERTLGSATLVTVVLDAITVDVERTLGTATLVTVDVVP